MAATGTHPEMRTGRSLLQSAVRELMPERPAKTLSQVDSASQPRGDTEPQPTIETRWEMCCRTAMVRRFGRWGDRYRAMPDGSGYHPPS